LARFVWTQGLGYLAVGKGKLDVRFSLWGISMSAIEV
jgi:hypothetical protein